MSMGALPPSVGYSGGEPIDRDLIAQTENHRYSEGLRVRATLDRQHRGPLLDAIRGADIVPGSERVLGSSGVNGPPTSVLLNAGHGVRVPAVIKSHTGREAADLAIQDLARLFKIGHLVPETAVRGGDLITAFALGEQAERVGITSYSQLVDAMDAEVRRLKPGIAPAQARTEAVTSIELAQLMDYMGATIDRHGRNVLASVDDPTVWWIDHGALGDGERSNPLVPAGDGTYLPSKRLLKYEVTLSDPTISFLREQVSAEDVRSVFMQHADADGRIGGTSVDRIMQRFHHAVDTGGFQISRNPLMETWFKYGGRILDRSPAVQQMTLRVRHAQDGVANLVRGFRVFQ